MFKSVLFLLVPLFIFSAILAPNDGNAVIIQTGDLVKLDFDLTGIGTPPPYTKSWYALNFSSVNLWDPGESFSVSLYGSTGGGAYYTFSSINTSISSFGSTQTIADLNSPFTDTKGYLLINNIVGSLDLYIPSFQSQTVGFYNADGSTGGLYTIPGATPVPEPSTMLLLGSGLAGLVGYGRRRMRK